MTDSKNLLAEDNIAILRKANPSAPTMVIKSCLQNAKDLPDALDLLKRRMSKMW